jgi:hypothetical protein
MSEIEVTGHLPSDSPGEPSAIRGAEESTFWTFPIPRVKINLVFVEIPPPSSVP